MLLNSTGVFCFPLMMPLRVSYLFFVYIFTVQVKSKNSTPFLNESSPMLGTVSKLGNLTGTALDRAKSTALPSSPSYCDGCSFNFEIENAPWASPTKTLLVLIDNSTNITSTSTIQDRFSTFETDVTIGFRRHIFHGVMTVPLEEKAHLTHPTLYDIFHGFHKYTTFPEYTTILNGTSASSSRLCRTKEISYTNVFAVPLVDGFEADGSALSNFESFFPTVGDNCTRAGFYPIRVPEIKVPVSALTITRTSYRSLATSASINPSPSAKPQNPVLLVTTTAHSKNDFETPHTDNASPKRITSQDFQSTSHHSPPLPPMPTPISEPQSTGSEQPLVQYNANGPVDLDSQHLNSLDPDISGSAESNSPNPTLALPVQLEFSGPNSPNLNSPGNSALTNPSPLKPDHFDQSVPTPHEQPESISPTKTQPNPGLPQEQPATRPIITVGSKPATANPFLQFVIDGETLSPGRSGIKVDGTPISLAPYASHMVIGHSTVLLASPQPSSLPRLTLEGSIITANSLSQFVIDRQTLRPGGPEITVSGTRMSLAPSAAHVVIAGNTVKIENSPSPLFTLPGRIITPDDESHYLIGGQTLIPGSRIYVFGTLISLPLSASEAIIDSSTIDLPTSSPLSLPFLTVGDQKFTANSAFQYIIDGQTLAAGSPAITVSGTPISLAPLASNVVIGGITVPFAIAPSTPHALIFGGKTIFPNSTSEYVISSQTIIPGAPAITISGTPISLALSASNIVIGSSTIPLISSATPLPPLTIDGTIILPNSASEYLIGGQTLIPGGSAITISDTRISLAPSASALIVNDKAIPLTRAPTTATALPLITIGNSVITPNAASQYIVAGQTLVPAGPAITVSGTRISLAPHATNVIVGTSTERLGRLILTGVSATASESVNPPASATGPVAFHSEAMRVYGQRWIVPILLFGWGLWSWL